MAVGLTFLHHGRFSSIVSFSIFRIMFPLYLSFRVMFDTLGFPGYFIGVLWFSSVKILLFFVFSAMTGCMHSLMVLWAHVCFSPFLVPIICIISG